MGSGVGGTPLLELKNLEVEFTTRRKGLVGGSSQRIKAVDDVSLVVSEGETLGLVGESGCGKTSLARCVVRLLKPSGGAVYFRGTNISNLGTRDLRSVRREIQMVFQDPEASLNPRKRVGQIIATGLRLRGVGPAQVENEVRSLLNQVGLSSEHINRFPHEFSGGQRQRIGIARALAVEPTLLVLDEPVSALDVSVQAQVINLLDDLQAAKSLSYIFVAHDLSVVRHVSDRIAVMYLGKVVEVSPAEDLYDKPIHPYTSALLSAVPIPERALSQARRQKVVRGEPADPLKLPSGCRFHNRCPRMTDICTKSEPPLVSYYEGHLAACHHPLDVAPSYHVALGESRIPTSSAIVES